MNCPAQAIVDAITQKKPKRIQSDACKQAMMFAIAEKMLFERMPDYATKYVLIVVQHDSPDTAVLDQRPDASYRAFFMDRSVAQSMGRSMKSLVTEVANAVNTNLNKILSQEHSHGPLLGFDQNQLLLYRRSVLRFVEERLRWKIHKAPYKIGKVITDVYLRTEASVDYEICCTLEDLYIALFDVFAPDKCAACDAQAGRHRMQRCGRCRQVRYCSKECQRLDWPEHKTHCDVHGVMKDENAKLSEGHFVTMMTRDAIRALAGFDEYVRV